MAPVEDWSSYFERAMRRNGELRSTSEEQSLAGGGGPPHDSDMEVRVARLEEALPRIERLLERIDAQMQHLATKEELAYLRGRVEQLPTTWVMLTGIIGGQVALAGLVIGVAKILSGH